MISSPCSPVRIVGAVFLIQLVQKKVKRQRGKRSFPVWGSSSDSPSPLHFSGQTRSACSKGLGFGVDPLFPFYCVYLLFPLCLAFYCLSLFSITNTVGPVSSCHLGHAGKQNKLLNCSAVPSRTRPLPHIRLLLFAAFTYVLSRDDKKGHGTPHSADKWSMKMIREQHWGEPTLLHAWYIYMPWSQACQLTIFHWPRIHRCTWMLHSSQDF